MSVTDVNPIHKQFLPKDRDGALCCVKERLYKLLEAKQWDFNLSCNRTTKDQLLQDIGALRDILDLIERS